jgi:hypothetical protein
MGGGPCAAPSPDATADHIVALALGGAGPFAGSIGRHPANRGDPPYDARERDSSNQSRATGSDFQDRNSSPAEPANILRPEKLLLF